MAETFIDEGLDNIIDVYLRGVAVDTTLFLGLFTSQTATTVPARTAVGGAAPSGWTEMTPATGTYARIALSTADWPAAATNGSGRRSTMAASKKFTGFTSGAPANGFFLATNLASGAGDKIVFFSNFDSGLARSLLTISDEINITPRFQVDV